jgi:hypothetical protein
MNFPGSLDLDALQRQLTDLMAEHRDLDDAINALAEQAHINQLQIQRMKKKKLALKDQIIRLESLLLPDIIA